MNIGIDFDGTIPNTQKWRQQYLLKKHSILVMEAYRLTKEELVPKIGKKAYAEMVTAYDRSSVLCNIPPHPGAVDAIQELAKDNRLYLITARTPDEIGRAAEYLETFDLRKHFTELHSTLDKPATCAALRVDTLIDDRRTHLRKQDVCFVPHMPDELFADDVSHMNAWEHAPKYVGGKHATD